MQAEGHSQLRLAELIASLSLSTDLGMGQPMEQALNTCFLSVRAGQALGLGRDRLSDVYYLALLRFVGCTADAHEAAEQVGGDEIALRSGIATVVMGDQTELMRFLLRHYAAGTPALTRLRLIASGMARGVEQAKRSIAVHCEIAQMLASRLGISRSVAVDVGSTFEYWDGKGVPGDLAGQDIPVAARIVAVARDVDLFNRMVSFSAAEDALRRRRGRAYDPEVADAFLADGESWLRELATGTAWDAVMAAEPSPPLCIGEAKLDDCLSAFADAVDLKAPFVAGHSTGVAELAWKAARVAGLSDGEATQLRRAGLVHDLGRAAIPNGIWEKPGPLSPSEWERVRLHPYLTERITSYAPALREIGAVAGLHHERLDGSGYHRGSTAPSLTTAARILAIADAYQAMSQPRPYRPALEPRQREAELRREVDHGRLDGACVSVVLEAAGLAAPSRAHGWPAGLTDREVEVLRLIVRGYPNRVVAERLTISPKTVGRHVENIYTKIGVSGRATAALFAMEHQLV